MAAIYAYIKELPRHKAEQQMLLLEATSFPHMEEKARKETLGRLDYAGQDNSTNEKEYKPLRNRATVVTKFPWETETESANAES